MEYARKMILMPQECLQQQTPPAIATTTTTTGATVQTPGTTTSRLDEEMCKILNSTMDEGEKCLKYEQTLQRFLRLRKEEQSRAVAPSFGNSIRQESEGGAPTSAVNTELTDSHILEAVPSKFRPIARQLVKRLRDAENITWDKRGIITLDGALVGANIIDLVNEAMRARKRPPPRGYSQFVRILRQAGIPREFVGNDRLWQAVITESAHAAAPAAVVNQEAVVERTPVRPSVFKQRKRLKLSQDTEAEEEEEEEEEEEGESQRQPQTLTGRLKWTRMRRN